MCKDHLYDENYPKDSIVKEGQEHIPLTFLYNTTIYLIDHIHQEVSEKDNRVNFHLISGLTILRSQCRSNQIVWFVKENECTEIHEHEYNNDLIHTLDNNITPHTRHEYLPFSADPRLSVLHWHFVFLRNWLSAERNGSQDVHD